MGIKVKNKEKVLKRSCCGADFRGVTVGVAVYGVGVSEARISIFQLIIAIIQFERLLLSYVRYDQFTFRSFIASRLLPHLARVINQADRTERRLSHAYFF